MFLERLLKQKLENESIFDDLTTNGAENAWRRVAQECYHLLLFFGATLPNEIASGLLQTYRSYDLRIDFDEILLDPSEERGLIREAIYMVESGEYNHQIESDLKDEMEILDEEDVDKEALLDKIKEKIAEDLAENLINEAKQDLLFEIREGFEPFFKACVEEVCHLVDGLSDDAKVALTAEQVKYLETYGITFSAHQRRELAFNAVNERPERLPGRVRSSFEPDGGNLTDNHIAAVDKILS